MDTTEQVFPVVKTLRGWSRVLGKGGGERCLSLQNTFVFTFFGETIVPYRAQIFGTQDALNNLFKNIPVHVLSTITLRTFCRHEAI